MGDWSWLTNGANKLLLFYFALYCGKQLYPLSVFIPLSSSFPGFFGSLESSKATLSSDALSAPTCYAFTPKCMDPAGIHYSGRIMHNFFTWCMGVKMLLNPQFVMHQHKINTLFFFFTWLNLQSNKYYFHISCVFLYWGTMDDRVTTQTVVDNSQEPVNDGISGIIRAMYQRSLSRADWK